MGLKEIGKYPEPLTRLELTTPPERVDLRVAQMIPPVKFLGFPDFLNDREIQEGLKGSLSLANDLLTNTARELLVELGLPSKPFREAKLVPIVQNNAGRFPTLSPGTYDPSKSECKFIANNFGRFLADKKKEWELMNSPMNLAFYLLSSVYAEEAVFHPLFPIRKNPGTQGSIIFCKAFRELYKNQNHEVALDPYSPYPPTDVCLKETEVEFSGLRSLFCWQGKYLLLRREAIINELMIKNWTLLYMRSIFSKLGLGVTDNQLTKVHTGLFELDEKEFLIMRQLLQGCERQIVPILLKSSLLERLAEAIFGESEEKAMEFALGTMTGNVPLFVDYLSEFLAAL